MFFNDNYYSVCRICGERNIFDIMRCQNCRTRLNNRRNNNIIPLVNYLNNDDNIPLNNFNNIFPEIKSNYTYNKPINEKLVTNIMTLDLYNENNNGDLEPKICCICQENIEITQKIYLLSCNHCFHKKCAIKWFAEKSQCPYCRKKFIFHKQ